MKYNKMFLMGLIFSALSYGMEQSIVSPHTAVNITKGSIYEADGTVDILVVGAREQKRLYSNFTDIVDENARRIDVHTDVCAVAFKIPARSDVYVMKKEDDSDSVEETYHHPCEWVKHCGHNYDWISINRETRVLWVVEPKLDQKGCKNQRKDYRYTSKKKLRVFRGEAAIMKAQSDLFICYKNVLKAGLKKLNDKKDKSIAIPTLSTSCYLPREDAAMVALATITTFVKNNPGAYSRIELFVKKRCEYDWYCEWLLQGPSGQMLEKIRIFLKRAEGEK